MDRGRGSAAAPERKHVAPAATGLFLFRGLGAGWAVLWVERECAVVSYAAAGLRQHGLLNLGESAWTVRGLAVSGWAGLSG